MRATGSGEERVVRGDDEVADPGQHQPARDACAVHLRDHRLRDLPPPTTHPDVDLDLAGQALVAAASVRVVPVQGGGVGVTHVELALRRPDVVTGGEVLAIRAEQAHCDSFIPKPVDLQRLRNVVEELIGQYYE